MKELALKVNLNRKSKSLVDGASLWVDGWNFEKVLCYVVWSIILLDLPWTPRKCFVVSCFH